MPKSQLKHFNNRSPRYVMHITINTTNISTDTSRSKLGHGRRDAVSYWKRHPIMYMNEPTLKINNLCKLPLTKSCHNIFLFCRTSHLSKYQFCLVHMLLISSIKTCFIRMLNLQKCFINIHCGCENLELWKVRMAVSHTCWLAKVNISFSYRKYKDYVYGRC